MNLNIRLDERTEVVGLGVVNGEAADGGDRLASSKLVVMGIGLDGKPHTLFPCVHDEPFSAEEADERQIEFPGQLNGQA